MEAMDGRSGDVSEPTERFELRIGESPNVSIPEEDMALRSELFAQGEPDGVVGGVLRQEERSMAANELRCPFFGDRRRGLMLTDSGASFRCLPKGKALFLRVGDRPAQPFPCESTCGGSDRARRGFVVSTSSPKVSSCSSISKKVFLTTSFEPRRRPGEAISSLKRRRDQMQQRALSRPKSNTDLRYDQ